MSKVLDNMMIGFVSTKGIMLDLDNISRKGAEKLADYLLDRYNLEGYIILKSSRQHYHIVFNRTNITWRKTMQILFSVNKAISWAIWQGKKGNMTLRVTPKNGNSVDLVCQKGEILGGLIQDYWKVRGFVETLE